MLIFGETIITAPFAAYFSYRKDQHALDNSQTSSEFLAMLPRTMSMTRYGDREYYGKVGKAISEEGQKIDDFSNGDVTYYAAGRSFAIFYAKEGESSQPGLIRMGKITSDLRDFEKLEGVVEMRIEVVK
ncbi:hypothetical protein PUS40_004393 [Vibrio alginolyticus]|nr:hypothetical protein [Vibrio alginolyticus]